MPTGVLTDNFKVPDPTFNKSTTSTNAPAVQTPSATQSTATSAITKWKGYYVKYNDMSDTNPTNVFDEIRNFLHAYITNNDQSQMDTFTMQMQT